MTAEALVFYVVAVGIVFLPALGLLVFVVWHFFKRK